MANMIKNAKRMQSRAGGRQDTYAELTVGTVVSLALANVDRGKTDLRRLPGVVIDVTERKLYRIGVKGGRLKNCYRRSDLVIEIGKTARSHEGLADTLNVDWRSLKELSLRQANELVSPVGGQGMLHCSCTGKCTSDRCSCKKVGHFCNSRCHAQNSKCENVYCEEIRAV